MKQERLNEVKQAIFDYNRDGVAGIVQNALAEGIGPLVITDALIQSVRDIGKSYENGTMFLPDMICAADTMNNALPILQEELLKRGQTRESLGTVVIGAVAGDIHTIGKAMVGAMLVAEGFEVYDIGINVATEKFLEAVKQHNPVILGMSALLTTTVPEAKKVIDALIKEGLRDRVKVMVGGGAVTEALAKSYGADGYDDTAPGAALVARKLIGK
jgi:corrinoid protein of di/trimethylamine methyltransferase